MKKTKPNRDKVVPVRENELVPVKGTSGYVITGGDDGPTDPPPTGGGT
jgi:hypothetical protein